MQFNNKIVFIPNGRFGNAFFRYMACAIVNIKNPTLSFCLEDEFVEPNEKTIFYRGVDHVGDDIRKTDKNIEENDPKVIAYNTLGYYKHSVDVDNLKSNMFINNENGHGLFVKTTITLNDDNFLNMIEKNMKYFHIKMNGYFQFGHIYLHYKKDILNYMEKHKFNHYIQTDLKEKILMRELLDDMHLPPEKQYDIVIHIRLGDFKGRPDYIEEKYYFDLFKTIDFKEKKKICLLFDPMIKTGDCVFIDNFIEWFKTRDIPVTIESNSLPIDFNIMKQAKILICSMSTLSWTAAYLSKHIQQCYMPDYNFYNIDPERSYNYFKSPIENTVLYRVKTTMHNISSFKPVILTLPQYSSRLDKLTDLQCKLSSIGLETTYYNGVNGKDIILENTNLDHLKFIHYKDSTYTYDASIRTNKKAMSKGEFGCAWSHINLLKQLLTEPDNINYYLILEDDVELVKPIAELLKLLQHIPEDTDICHLAKSDWYPFMKTSNINAYFSECVKAYFNRTTAYIISRKGAEKVLAYSNNHIDIPIDDLYCKIYRTTHNFHFYVPTADYFFKEQDNISSTISDINNTLK